MTFQKYIVATLCLFFLSSLTAQASVRIMGADDDELKSIAKIITDSHGQQMPTGWKVEKTKYSSCIVDNRDDLLNRDNYLSQVQIDEDLAASITACSIKRIQPDAIECVIKRQESDDLGVSFVHYIRSKTFSLKRGFDSTQFQN